MSKQSPIAAKDIDALTEEEIADRFKETTDHIDAIKALWPGLTRLEEVERTTSGGRNISVFSPALRLLFGVLRTKDGKPTEIAKYFDALGDTDHGEDPEKFEPELLARRLVRVEHQQKIHAALDQLQRHFADDTLHTANQVMEPGLLALAMARTLSTTNKAFKSTLAPVIDALREMTKHARAASVKARSEKKSEAEK